VDLDPNAPLVVAATFLLRCHPTAAAGGLLDYLVNMVFLFSHLIS
jgi:hypothetical protein